MLAPRRDDLVALALLSVAAGFVHASVIDGHRGHGIAAGVFAALAVFQIVWAGLVLARPNRGVLALGALANGAIVAGWVLSRTTGIGFIDGFQEAEAIGFTDAVAAGLEAVLALGAVLLAFSPERRLLPTTMRPVALALTAIAVASVGVPAVAQAGSHGGADHAHGAEEAAVHADGDGPHHASHDEDHGAHADEHASHSAEEHAEHADHAAFPILQVTADGRLVGGDPNATPEQRAAAEQLLRETRMGMWQWTDDAAVHAAGFRSIGDGPTGTEHLVNWGWIDDDIVLDPNFPESLVYRVTPTGRVLEAAMFMVPPGTPESEIPDVGGTLTQWHIHDNLCYSPAEMVDGFPQRRVIGLTDAERTCHVGENLGPPHAPMLHVWLVEQRCGPFSSLEGVGAGQAVAEEQDDVTPAECLHSH